MLPWRDKVAWSVAQLDRVFSSLSLSSRFLGRVLGHQGPSTKQTSRSADPARCINEAFLVDLVVNHSEDAMTDDGKHTEPLLSHPIPIPCNADGSPTNHRNKARCRPLANKGRLGLGEKREILEGRQARFLWRPAALATHTLSTEYYPFSLSHAHHRDGQGGLPSSPSCAPVVVVVVVVLLLLVRTDVVTRN